MGPELGWKVIRDLCYHQHGGSGYSFTRADVLDMSWGEAAYYLKSLGELRAAEAKAIKSASKVKR